MEIMKESVLQFEYKFGTRYEILEKIAEQNILKHKTNYSDVLNELGKDGWELVSVLQYSENSTYIFKRSKWVEKKAQEKQEKQDDNSNKVERKFKVGDWIVNQHGTVRHIEEVGNVGYQTDEGWRAHDYYEKNFHLWTIADAKDVDVLYSSCCKLLWIYKDEKTCHVCSNLNYNSGSIVINKPICIPTDVQPATKEQRDILFQKMKEAGYEWDNKEKKPIKSEVFLPSFDEQQGSLIIDIPFGAKDSQLQEASYHIPEGFHAEIQGDKVVIKKWKNTSWSECDSFMTRTLIDVVNSRASIRPELRNEFINWLESLKNRIKGE